MTPVVILLAIQLFVLDIQPKIRVFLLIVLIVTFIVQLIYTYIKWQSERHTEFLDDI